MKPNRVPDDLIQASSDAIRAWCTANPDKYLDDRTQMRIAVAAALTLHNEQVEQPLRERAETAEREVVELRAEAADPYSPQHIAESVKRARCQRDEAVEAIAAERDEYVAELAELRASFEFARTAQHEQWERAVKAEKELADLRERIGKGETPDSHCPWCGMAMWLDGDGLAPLHDHPVNDGRCPGIGRRPSDQWRDGEWKAAEDPSWTDHGDGWKSRRPTLADFQGPFTGLLGPFGLHDDGGIGGEGRA